VLSTCVHRRSIVNRRRNFNSPITGTSSIHVSVSVCNSPIALPPYGKLTSSSEKAVPSTEAGGGTSINGGGGSCHAEDGYIVTNKAWCAKHDNGTSAHGGAFSPYGLNTALSKVWLYSFYVRVSTIDGRSEI